MGKYFLDFLLRYNFPKFKGDLLFMVYSKITKKDNFLAKIYTLKIPSEYWVLNKSIEQNDDSKAETRQETKKKIELVVSQQFYAWNLKMHWHFLMVMLHNFSAKE